MSQYERTFAVTPEVARRVERIAWHQIGDFNSKKIGRNRRGQLLLNSVDYFWQGDQVRVTVRFFRGHSSFVRVYGVGRFRSHRLSDFRKLLRLLST